MKIRWFGQSAFLLSGSVRVAIDPFGDVGDRLTARGLQFGYPRLQGVDADVLLITHEHFDHNAADAIGGDPETVRSTAGTFDTPAGEMRAIASEHDDAAGTRRGPNTIFAFALDGLRLCHFGDFGQASLRPEQRAAIGDVDVLMLPIGGGPTVGDAAADALPHRGGQLPRPAGCLPGRVRRRGAPDRRSRGRAGRPARERCQPGYRGLDAAHLAARCCRESSQRRGSV
jgi:L-ascorbate metabolism protein UlaG (beta-lactamase superfamily)